MTSADEEFIRQLREVFDLCDELKCGFISVDQLREIVRKHFGGNEEEIAQLIECLDPNRHGVVTFPDFCRGVVSALQNKGTSFEEAAARCQPTVVVNSPTDETDRGERSPPPHGDTDSAIATGSDVSRESLADKRDSPSDGDDEECYASQGHLSRPDGNSSSSFRSGASSTGSTNGRRRRSSRMLSRSGSKRLSSSALAKELHRSSSRRNSVSSEEMFPVDPSLEDDVSDLSQKVVELQQQVAALSDNQATANTRYNKVKQENAALLSKIHSLEEQMRELELMAEDRLRREQKELREMMTRHERESKQEVERYANSLMKLQQEYMQVSEEVIRLKTQIEKLREEKQRLSDQLSENINEMTCLREEHMKLQESIRRERDEFAAERESGNRLLEELTRELEMHRQCSQESRARSPSLLELPAQYRELEKELRKVRTENKRMQETNDELHAQLLSTSLQEGRSLLHEGDNASLADEFDKLTKDEMMNALREQKEVNAKLRAYIDGILLNIMENHPQLLEVKTPG